MLLVSERLGREGRLENGLNIEHRLENGYYIGEKKRAG